MTNTVSTPEQILIDKIYKDTMDIGYSTNPINKEKLSEIIFDIYKFYGLNKPKLFFVSSPEELKKFAQSSEIHDERNLHEIKISIVYIWEFYWLKTYIFALELEPNLANEMNKEELLLWDRFLNEAHAALFYDEAVILSERPKELHVDSVGFLHNDKGPAIAYSDGFSYYSYHDVNLNNKSWIITNPEKITVEEIDKEKNSEIKRVMLEIFGLEKYLTEGNAELIHEDDWGKLWRKPIKNTEFVITMVQMTDSTSQPNGIAKIYFEEVHPELCPLFPNGKLGNPQELTAKNAVASRFGLYGDEYYPSIET